VAEKVTSLLYMMEYNGNLEELMSQALAGDKRAYTVVLEQTSRFLRPYIAKRVNSASDTEEIIQEILISIHKARHTYDGKRLYKPWAFAIAKFRLMDHLRKLYSDHLRYADDLEKAENISSDDVTKETLSYESIREEVEQLPGKQPAILRLLHAEGHTLKETAEKMQMTESAVKVAAHRAYKVLKKKLGG